MDLKLEYAALLLQRIPSSAIQGRRAVSQCGCRIIRNTCGCSTTQRSQSSSKDVTGTTIDLKDARDECCSPHTAVTTMHVVGGFAVSLLLR